MDPQTIQFYDAHAPELAVRYAAADVAPVQELLRRWLPAGAQVLEVGCGTGREAAWLVQNGFTVTATDASAVMLATARMAVPGATMLQAAFPLPPDAPLLAQRFDAVLALAVLMHIPDAELLDTACQLRQLLRPGGTLLLSVSENRSLPVAAGAATDAPRDEHGRLFHERPPAEIGLLFERLGFQLVAREETTDGLQRPGLRWTTLVLRLHGAGTRPVDQIETIINRDKKTATYKLALLRALCDIAQTAAHHVRWHSSDDVSVPLGLVAERWLYYYWPLVEAGITQIRGGREGFRATLQDLQCEFRNAGGLDAFHVAFQNNSLTPSQQQQADAVLNAIAKAIVTGPVTFAGGALDGDTPFFQHTGSMTARRKCATPTGLLLHLGRIHFRAEIWRELSLVGHWIGEAILLRWAELAHGFSHQTASVATILERLLIRPTSDRDVAFVRQIYAQFAHLECVWTGRSLLAATGTEGACSGFAVDHVIPFSLWHNNDLWNLLPAHPKVNGAKSDSIVTRDTLQASRERVIHCWQQVRDAAPFRFDCELSRTLLGRSAPEAQWEKPAFAALCDAAEMLAIQRGIERWPKPGSAHANAGASVLGKPFEKGSPSTSPFTSPAPVPVYLPVVGDLAAGELFAGFATGSLADIQDCERVAVPAELAGAGRFVVRIAGRSMEPTLMQGTLAVFEYHRTPRQDGQIVIVAEFAETAGESGQVAVKRYHAHSADPTHWCFTSDNPEYPGIRLPKTNHSYPILGILVEPIKAE